MIDLMQHSADESLIKSSYIKPDEIKLKLNKNLILKDKDKLDLMYKDKVSNFDSKNIKALKSYLDKILKFIDDEGNFEIAWHLDTGLPVSYPSSLISEKAYGINTCNYIEIEKDEHLVELDLTDLADLIAFSYIYKDLGETHSSIEELLKDCGIVGVEEASILTNYFKETGDTPFEFSKQFKIGETIYYSYDTKDIIDYFNTKRFKTREYREVVEYSCKYASTIIISNIIKNSIHLNLEVKPIMINSTNITFLVKVKDGFDIKNTLIDDISIRIFGRKFKIEKKLEIF